MPLLDAQAVRSIFGHFPSGVVAIGACVNDQPEVLVASSFTVGVSLDPPLVMFAVQRSSSTWPRLRRAGVVGVTVLRHDQALLCRQLSSKNREARLQGVPIQVRESGTLEIEENAGWLECRIHSIFAAGDHDVVVLEVSAARVDQEADPLVWHGSGFRLLERKENVA